MEQKGCAYNRNALASLGSKMTLPREVLIENENMMMYVTDLEIEKQQKIKRKRKTLFSRTPDFNWENLSSVFPGHLTDVVSSGNLWHFQLCRPDYGIVMVPLRLFALPSCDSYQAV